MPEDQQQFSGGSVDQVPAQAVETHGSPTCSTRPCSLYIFIAFIIIVLGLGCWVGIQYVRYAPLILTEVQEVPPLPSVIPTGTSSEASTYVDADGRFSLEYSSDLTPQVSRDIAHQIDSVSFKGGTTTIFSLHVQRANARWPDLQAYLNDQILVSKGGEDMPEKYFTSTSGTKFLDVGKRQFGGHMFFAEMSPTEFIEFRFFDEMLVEPVLSSIVFSKPTVAPDSVLNIPEGWNVLKSAEYGFEIGYPTDYTVAKKQNEVGVGMPNAWKISQLGELPPKHSPRTVSVEVIDPKTIRANRLDGTYMKYDAERGVCYNESFGENPREYLDGVINGYVACRYSVGDAGSFGSAVYIIYPDKVHALKVSTGADEYQEMAPLDDFAKTVRLITE